MTPEPTQRPPRVIPPQGGSATPPERCKLIYLGEDFAAFISTEAARRVTRVQVVWNDIGQFRVKIWYLNPGGYECVPCESRVLDYDAANALLLATVALLQREAGFC